MPNLSGTRPQTTWEMWQERAMQAWEDFLMIFQTGVWQTAKEWALLAWGFVRRNLHWFGLLLLVWAGIWALKQRARAQQQRVQRLWLFLLYFLAKRHGLIPLLHSTAKRENLLPESHLQRLVEIRQRCREISLRRNPDERIKAEEELSGVFYGCLEQLANNGELESHPALAAIVDDLQFIDGKLVQLQAEYNDDASHFNARMVDTWWGKIVSRLGRYDRFALFGQGE